MLRSRPSSRSLAATLALIAAACGGGDTAAPTAPSSPTANAGTAGAGPSSIISDATRNNGDPRFYWLAPIVKGSTPAATFDADAQPQVSVCVIGTVTANAPCVGEPIATFSRTTGSGSETVRVDAAAEQYIVNFHTDRFDLDPAKTYRITVQLDGRRLGFADLELADKPGELKNVNTAEYVPLVDGRTLPVKFSIRQGIVVSPTAVADAYPVGGGLLDRKQTIAISAADGLLANDDLGVPAAQVDPASLVVTDDLGGTITLQPDGSFTLAGATRNGTAAFSYTIRNGPTSSSTASVQLAVGLSPTAVNDVRQMVVGSNFGFGVLGNDDRGSPEAILSFAPLPTSALGGTLRVQFGNVFLDGPTQTGTVQLEYTLTNAVGSSTGQVTIEVVPLALSLTAVAGDGQSAPAGTAVPVPPAFRLLDQFGRAVPGRSVQFEASLGSRTARSTFTTDPGGYAYPGTWTLGIALQPYTLRASTNGTAPVEITANATCRAGVVTRLELASQTFDGFYGGDFFTSKANWRTEVRAVDGCGNPVAGQSLDYNGEAVLTPVVTNADGIAKNFARATASAGSICTNPGRFNVSTVATYGTNVTVPVAASFEVPCP